MTINQNITTIFLKPIVNLFYIIRIGIYRNPNDTECELDAYWKVNNKLEIAGSFKSHLRHPEWKPHDQEIGMIYKCSDRMFYGLKTDLTGNISAGLSLLLGKCNGIKVFIVKQLNLLISFCFSNEHRFLLSTKNYAKQ